MDEEQEKDEAYAQPGGAVGAPASPGRRKKIRRNLQGKFVSAPPAHQVHRTPRQSKSQFL